MKGSKGKKKGYFRYANLTLLDMGELCDGCLSWIVEAGVMIGFVALRLSVGFREIMLPFAYHAIATGINEGSLYCNSPYSSAVLFCACLFL